MRSIKKVMMMLFATSIIVALTIVACKKNGNESMANQNHWEESEPAVTKAVDSDKEILNDESFKKLIRTNTKLMRLFVESEVAPDSLVFDDVSVLCRQIGVSDSEFMRLYGDMNESIEKLSARYDLRGDVEDCPLCSLSENDRIQYLINLISLFRDSPEISYDLEDYYGLELAPDGGDDFGPCERPVLAMICITVCVASSAEVPPIMALCCYACICSYCPNNPLCVKIDSFSIK